MESTHTKKDLIEAIRNLPDDTPVVVDYLDPAEGYIPITELEIEATPDQIVIRAL